MARTIETIERRVNELGVAEPGIARQGTAGDEILIQLPGMTNVDRAKAIIQAGGTLEFRLVEPGPAASPDESNPGLRLSKFAAVTGRDLRSARPSLDENGQPAVSFTLTTEGGRKFGEVTAANIGRQLAIVVDGKVRSVARIDNRITTDGSIHGSFTQQETRDLRADPAVGRTAGAADVSRRRIDQREPRRRLDPPGRDRIHRGPPAGDRLHAHLLSGIGVNAAVALVFNLVILLGLMAYVGVVMTLPGIAGFVLTMGIGVDSNVLVFERIREEREAGKSARASIDAGFSRVFLTLLDTHIAALNLCGIPVSVRHGTDPRFCRDAVHRAVVKSVHVDVCFKDVVRAGARKKAQSLKLKVESKWKVRSAFSRGSRSLCLPAAFPRPGILH